MLTLNFSLALPNMCIKCTSNTVATDNALQTVYQNRLSEAMTQTDYQHIKDKSSDIKTLYHVNFGFFIFFFVLAIIQIVLLGLLTSNKMHYLGNTGIFFNNALQKLEKSFVNFGISKNKKENNTTLKEKKYKAQAEEKRTDIKSLKWYFGITLVFTVFCLILMGLNILLLQRKIKNNTQELKQAYEIGLSGYVKNDMAFDAAAYNLSQSNGGVLNTADINYNSAPISKKWSNVDVDGFSNLLPGDSLIDVTISSMKDYNGLPSYVSIPSDIQIYNGVKFLANTKFVFQADTKMTYEEGENKNTKTQTFKANKIYTVGNEDWTVVVGENNGSSDDSGYYITSGNN